MKAKFLILLIGVFMTLSGCANMPQPDWENFRPFQPVPNFITPTRAQYPAAAAQNNPQSGVVAYWTGKQNSVQTITNQVGWNCEYSYAGKTFWRTFVGTCPSSVQVQ